MLLTKTWICSGWSSHVEHALPTFSFPLSCRSPLLRSRPHISDYRPILVGWHCLRSQHIRTGRLRPWQSRPLCPGPKLYAHSRSSRIPFLLRGCFSPLKFASSHLHSFEKLFAASPSTLRLRSTSSLSRAFTFRHKPSAPGVCPTCISRQSLGIVVAATMTRIVLSTGYAPAHTKPFCSRPLEDAPCFYQGCMLPGCYADCAY